MYVAFQKDSRTFFGKVIRLWTRGEYSHTELVFSDGKWFSSDETDKGTRFIDGPKPNCNYDYIYVPVTSYDEERIRKFCENENGCAYDKKGIGFSFLPIPIGYQSETRWFCSEVCTAALQLAQYCIGYTPSRVHPNKLYKILNAELNK